MSMEAVKIEDAASKVLSGESVHHRGKRLRLTNAGIDERRGGDAHEAFGVLDVRIDDDVGRGAPLREDEILPVAEDDSRRDARA